MSDAQIQFGDVCRNEGLEISGLPEMDGQIHRVPVIGGKKGNRDGAYILHANGRPAGFVQNYRTDRKLTWRIGGEVSASSSITPQEIAERQAARDRLRQAEADVAAETAQALWSRASQAPVDHPYLVRKQVQLHGLRILNGDLLVPCFDVAGRIRSVQRICADGRKLFTKGSSTSRIYLILGDLHGNEPILICEGFATAASLHELSGWPTVAAFNAGNLLPVATLVRERFTRRCIVVCGDDDCSRVPNVGREKATRAAHAINGALIFPPSAPSCTDWNDHAVQAGQQVARQSLLTALRAALSDTREKTDANNG